MKIVGPYTSPTIYSENPGIVELVSSDPSVASVDASVVIPGTRVWRNGLKHGQYLARANCLQARTNCAWFVEVQSKDAPACNNGVPSTCPFIMHIQNIDTAAINRTNWGFMSQMAKTHAGSQYFQLYFLYSLNNTSNTTILSGTALVKQISTWPHTTRLIVTYDGTNLRAYSTTGTAAEYTTAVNLNNTMGGTEATIMQAGCKFAKMEGGLPSQAQREAFMASGTLPSGLAASYQGGHEIVESAPVFWDTSGNNLDLSAVDVTYWPEAAASGDYTDDPLDPVIPFQPFTITPNSTGTFTITARRRRQGVPDRATDEEKYETTSETFTITEMPAEVVQYVRLLITTSTPGTVDIASSDPAVVTFPASVVVGPTLQYEVLGTVVGAGTSTITTSMGGAVLDTTTVTIEDTPTVIEAGPNQDVRTKLL